MPQNYYENIEDKIIILRDRQVIIDSDVADLYGVETKRINEAVSNNPEKFPEGYVFELNDSEWESLKSKFSTSNRGGKVKLPKAFTEKGMYMLATILKSARATATTIAIIEAFAKIRERGKNIRKMSEMESEKEKHSLMRRSGEIISEIYSRKDAENAKKKIPLSKGGLL